MTITAAAFKAGCLAIMDQVHKTREPVIITKRGKPIARLVPVSGQVAPRDAFGCMAGSAVLMDDLIQPTGESWDADR